MATPKVTPSGCPRPTAPRRPARGPTRRAGPSESRRPSREISHLGRHLSAGVIPGRADAAVPGLASGSARARPASYDVRAQPAVGSFTPREEIGIARFSAVALTLAVVALTFGGAAGAAPDLGPNVIVLNPSMPM